MTEPHPALRNGPTREHEFGGAIYTLTEAHPAADRYPWLPEANCWN